MVNRSLGCTFVLVLVMMLSKFSRSWRVVTNNVVRTKAQLFHCSSPMYAKKKQQVENIDDFEIPEGESGWVTVRIGGEASAKDAEMEERIRQAKNWESSHLSDDKIKKVNRFYDIEDDILASEEERHPGTLKSQRRGKDRDSDKFRKDKGKDAKQKLQSLLNQAPDAAEKKRIKGLLELNPFVCSGCGTNFQSKTADAPGYLPSEKFKEHREKAEFIRQKQEAIKILRLAAVELSSPAAEALLHTAKIPENVISSVMALGESLDTDTPASSESKSPTLPSPTPRGGGRYSGSISGIVNDLSVDDNTSTFELAAKTLPDKELIDSMISSRSRKALEHILGPKQVDSIATLTTPAPASAKVAVEDEICICQRCFRLQQYGQVDQSLRPGWSDNEFLTPERFETLLGSIQKTESVVTCLVDIFDVEGSIVKNLRQIAGDNPVVIGVNKVDLLPKDISKIRVQQWVHSELKRICGFVGPKNRDDEKFISAHAKNVLKLSNIHLISCKNDAGVSDLMKNIMELAKDHGNRIHVMGAANVGKSSFINRILDPNSSTNSKMHTRRKNKTPLVTVSNLPGTTLDFLKIKLPNGMTVIDTPGLINSGHLTSKLTTEELRQVIPSKPINAVTFRIEETKCVLMGGFARIELTEVIPL